MAMRSTLVTCPTKSTVNQYALSKTLPSSVDTDNLSVDSKAKIYYSNLIKDYTNVIKYFNAAADAYTNAAKCTTGKVKTGCTNVAKTLKTQANNCSKRKQELVNAFKFDVLENRIKILEDSLN